MEEPLVGVGIRNWKKGKMREGFAELFTCLQAYDPACTIDGDWYDRETGKRLHKNHLKCMLKRDYAAKGGSLTGTKLQRMIDALLKACEKVTKDLVGKDSGNKVMIELKDEFL